MTESQSGSERQDIDPSRVIPAKEYIKLHPQPVILHFQPTGFIRMETPDELRQWEEMVRDVVGLNVAIPGSGGSGDDGGTGTQTICDLSTGTIIDDCDSD